jgi:hypothetical protein
MLLVYTVAQTSPNKNTTATKSAKPDPPSTEAAAFEVVVAVEPVEVAVPLLDVAAEPVAAEPVTAVVVEAVTVLETVRVLVLEPPLVVVVVRVTEAGGYEVLLAGAEVFWTSM